MTDGDKSPPKKQSVTLALLLGLGLGLLSSRNSAGGGQEATLIEVAARTIGAGVGMALVAVIYNWITFNSASRTSDAKGDRAPGGREMSAFLWPTKIKAEPGGIARFGRVLHWLFVAIAAAFVIGGAVYLFAGIGWEGPLASMFFGGGGFFLFARALRYILAGE